MKRILLSSACFLSVMEATVFFKETFDSAWEDRWTLSQWKSAQMGTWERTAGKWFRDEEENSGIKTVEDARFFGAATHFKPFSNKGLKELIVQYQVKYEKDIQCGGGYLKLGPQMDDLTQFGDPTKYNIMFGPDKCGYSKRTHVIFEYKGKNVLKKQDVKYGQEKIGVTHLYRLTVKPDNTVRVDIDNEKVYEGSLTDDWEMLSQKEIDDPEDKKPDDWVDDAMIPDSDDHKPDDWVDEKRIVDPSAQKPDDWDDQEDGQWEPPMIDNPQFKGEWVQKKVTNREYKGKWSPGKIPNPEFVDDKEISLYKEFGFIGFDLWQVQAGSVFDNIILTDDITQADSLALEWSKLNKVEVERYEEDEKEREAERERERLAHKAAEEENKRKQEDDDDDIDDDEEL